MLYHKSTQWGENMPVMNQPLLSRVKLTCDNGLDQKEKQLTKQKTLSNVKNDATDQDVFDTVLAITSLQEKDVLKIIRENNHTLI